MPVALMFDGPSPRSYTLDPCCCSPHVTATPCSTPHACAAGEMLVALMFDGPSLRDCACPATPVPVLLLSLVQYLVLVVQGICQWP